MTIVKPAAGRFSFPLISVRIEVSHVVNDVLRTDRVGPRASVAFVPEPPKGRFGDAEIFCCLARVETCCVGLHRLSMPTPGRRFGPNFLTDRALPMAPVTAPGRRPFDTDILLSR